MSTIRSSSHCLIFVTTIILVSQATDPPKQVTVDAAVVVPGFDILSLYGREEVLEIPILYWGPGMDNNEFNLADRIHYVPADWNIRSAYIDEYGDGSYDYVYLGDTHRYIKSVNRGQDSTYQTLDYEPEFEFIKDGGPDAAMKKGDKVIFFKGCQMATRNAPDDWEAPEDVESFGLPCHPDAAWEEETTMIILRGDQIWKWQEDGVVDGPHPFNETYTITSWILKPYREVFTCPDGWHLYEETNMCYGLFNDAVTWFDANDACQAVGGGLTKIKDSGTLEFVNDLMKDENARYWIGLHEVKQEGKWVWHGEDEEATFTNWAEGEPNDEDCTIIKPNLQWTDVGCRFKFRYSCQLPAT